MRSLLGTGWDFVVMQLFGGHTCFCTQPLSVRKTKNKENKNNNKKPSCSRQVGFWRNHILICHWCLLGYLDMGLQPSRKALRTECPWETGLVSPPDQVPQTFRSKVLFVLLSLSLDTRGQQSSELSRLQGHCGREDSSYFAGWLLGYLPAATLLSS